MKDTCKIGFAGTDARTLLSALVVSTAKSESCDKDYKGMVIRGTSAMPELAKQERMNWPIDFVQTENNTTEAYANAIISSIQSKELDYVIPMPEALLFDGIIDILDKHNFADQIVGVSQEASFIEADKIGCKKLCDQAKVPVADAWTVVDAKSYKEVLSICLEYIHRYGGVVLKYPYSAAGKGARVILNTWEIKEVYDTLIHDYKKEYKRFFKNKEWPLLVESRMSGMEISFTIFVDGLGHFQVLPTSMDYPERFEGQASKDNPITGGMGSISPHPMESASLLNMVENSVARPLIKAMRERGILRPCILYPGCFVSFEIGENGEFLPKALRVCEINIRPGEPEFQPIVRRLCNLGALIEAMFTGNLNAVVPEVRQEQISLCVALATGPGGPDGQRGYPWSVTKYEPLEIDYKYMHKKNIQVVPSGMGYSEEKGFYSDGTRVAYLNVNGSIQSDQKRGDVAEKLRNKIITAYDGNRIRVVPREDSSGNRLTLRRDIGAHFKVTEDILADL